MAATGYSYTYITTSGKGKLTIEKLAENLENSESMFTVLFLMALFKNIAACRIYLIAHVIDKKLVDKILAIVMLFSKCLLHSN